MRFLGSRNGAIMAALRILRPTHLALLLFVAVCSPAEVLPVRAYTTAEGLAHDHINRIFPDSRGFLWICTDDGLSRFDGNQFVNYTTASGLPHMHVNDMLETRGGEIGSQPMGVSPAFIREGSRTVS